MAIQIFGSSKSFDTKKALRWFAERRIPVQEVSLKDKGISAGEPESVISCLSPLAAHPRMEKAWLLHQHLMNCVQRNICHSFLFAVFSIKSTIPSIKSFSRLK